MRSSTWGWGASVGYESSGVQLIRLVAAEDWRRGQDLAKCPAWPHWKQTVLGPGPRFTVCAALPLAGLPPRFGKRDRSRSMGTGWFAILCGAFEELNCVWFVLQLF